MSEIGAGSGTSYPTSLDTNNNQEVNAPAAGKTRARAEVINDLAAAIVAIETELGTAPKGTAADVKTFLQVQHNLDGTHKSVSTNTLSATGQITSTLATGTAPLVIASTTKVTNLNADLLNGYSEATANTISTIVRRDGSGNFAAGTITAALTGNATTATSATSATTATNASGTGTAVYSEANGLRILRGGILANGAVDHGTGFTANWGATGVCTVTITETAFSGEVTVVASGLGSTTIGMFSVDAGSPTSSFVVRSFDNTGAAATRAFEFIAIGVK